MVSADLKIGVVLLHDENIGYDAAHLNGIKKAAAELGIPDDQIIWKYNIAEDEKCTDAINELIEAGCSYIFTDSYGHQTFTEQCAKDNPEVNFVAMTGDRAAPSKLANFSNAFTRVYESRYISGIVAGLKLKELIDAGTITTEQAKVGYVGAYPYAEVVSGYTAFYLGIKSIVPEVTMDVQYTGSWADITKETEAANALMARGCVIIGQHADTEGAPRAVEAALAEGKVVYSVGYNVDMLTAAPNAALTSATNDWSKYYKFAFEKAIKGEKIDTNWSAGYEADAVAITALGTSCAKDTQAAVDTAIAGIKAGTLHVFDTANFTVNGAALTTYEVDFSVINFADGSVIYEGEKYEAIKDGYFDESTGRSAPYFDLRIDGITELNAD